MPRNNRAKQLHNSIIQYREFVVVALRMNDISAKKAMVHGTPNTYISMWYSYHNRNGHTLRQMNLVPAVWTTILCLTL